MVNELGFKVITNAVSIRLKRGENLQEIVDSYPKLSDEQKQELLDKFSE